MAGVHTLEILLIREAKTLIVGTCRHSLAHRLDHRVGRSVIWAPACEAGIKAECHHAGSVGVMVAHRKFLHRHLSLCTLSLSSERHQHSGFSY